jgi:hypothetical protein
MACASASRSDASAPAYLPTRSWRYLGLAGLKFLKLQFQLRDLAGDPFRPTVGH